MKVSVAWLKEWVQCDLSPQQIAEKLTAVGLQVETLIPASETFTRVVVAQVKSIQAHPNAERLRVCQVLVNENTHELLNIVCGAFNFTEGAKVPVALDGAVLPGNIKIKKSKLRGEESHGMICSANELRLGEYVEKAIMLLPDDAPIGRDLREYLQLDDTIIEFDLTPNRGDCLSVQGIVRELAACAAQTLIPLAIAPSATVAAADTSFKVTVEASADCPQYVGRIIRGINAKTPTPLWMQEKLRKSGMHPINIIVDITNYVMQELGQPLHAFDLHKLHKGIVVRKAKAGESLALLNDQVLQLQVNDLVIADHQQAQALAGIMGGAFSAVSLDTSDIFLESAFFAPTLLAGRARSHGLHTESSRRFERGVDPALAALAVERFTQLLLAIAGGVAEACIVAMSTSQLPQPGSILLRRARISKILGVVIDDEKIIDYLTRLNITISMHSQGWQVVPPSYRFDLQAEIDFIEELARMLGYDNIPATPPRMPMQLPHYTNRTNSLADRGRAILAARGYHETINYSFIDRTLQDLLQPSIVPVQLKNPISSEMSALRTSLWPSLLQTLLHNQARQQTRLRLFEVGVCYLPTPQQFTQPLMLAGLAWGSAVPEQWGQQATAVDFYDVKEDVQVLLHSFLGTQTLQFVATADPALHPRQAAEIIYNNEQIAVIGSLHPQIMQTLGIQTNVILFAVHLDKLMTNHIVKFKQISKFPAIRRDIAIIVNEELLATTICTTIAEKAGESLQEIDVFDVYRDDNIGVNRKSIGLALTLQHPEKTLTDNEVDKIMERIIASLETTFNATLRT